MKNLKGLMYLLCIGRIETMDRASPTQVYVAYAIGYFEDVDLVAWAAEYVRNRGQSSNNPSLLELARLNPKRPKSFERAGDLLKELVKTQWPDFDLHGSKAEAYAKRCFKLRLEEYLSDPGMPWRVCRMIDKIERHYDFPLWLGSMFDACDWVELDTPLHACPDLEETIRETLAEL